MMSCCEDEELRIQRIHSQNIDSQLEEEHKRLKKFHNILVLGPKGSGKSTIVKQIKIANGGYDELERQEEAKNVRATVRHIIESLITDLDQSNPTLILENESNIPKLHFIQDYIHNLPSNHSNFPKEFYECCDALWQDKAIEKCYSRCIHYIHTDFMSHSKLMEIAKEDYLPSDNDIFRAQRWSTGSVHETTIDSRAAHFRLLEVNLDEHLSRSRKWAQYFYKDITAIIFVVDVSSFNIIPSNEQGDKSKNKLRESLNLFETIIRDRYLVHATVNIVFFNKTDLLKPKLDNPNLSLADYFPEFNSFPTPADNEGQSHLSHYYLGGVEDNDTFSHFRTFLKDLFGRTISQSSSDGPHPPPSCYCHFTTAYNTENIKRIFEVCRTSIYERLIQDMWSLL